MPDRSKGQVVIVGPGYMGRSEAEIWQKFSSVGFIVNGSYASDLPQKLDVPLLVTSPDNLIRFVTALRGLAKTTDTWNISAPTNLHGIYMEFALRAGVRKIFVEKPSTDNPAKSRKISQRYPEALIQVDYIERGHPVVLAIKDEMLRADFKPRHFFHWRAHDVRKMIQEGRPKDLTYMTFTDSVHDISEIDYLLKASTGVSLETNQPEIGSSLMRSWQEKYPGEYPWKGDVETDVILTVGGIQARIKGQGDFDHRRYFVVYNDEMAFFGQTLDRPNLNITRCAAKIEGKRNVTRLLELAQGGEPVNDDDFGNLFKETSAQVLDLSPYNQNAMEVMIRNLHEAKEKSDLISPLSTAIAI